MKMFQFTFNSQDLSLEQPVVEQLEFRLQQMLPVQFTWMQFTNCFLSLASQGDWWDQRVAVFEAIAPDYVAGYDLARTTVLAATLETVLEDREQERRISLPHSVAY